MKVTFDVLSSIDVTPSEEQKEAIAHGENAEITFTSSDFDSDAEYLLIHESEARDGEYDVMLSKAKGNDITMSLPDLSPVTIVSVNVEKIPSIDSAAEDTVEEGEPEPIVEQEDKHPYAAVAYILIIICVGVLVVLFIQIKKRGGLNAKKK